MCQNVKIAEPKVVYINIESVFPLIKSLLLSVFSFFEVVTFPVSKIIQLPGQILLWKNSYYLSYRMMFAEVLG